MTAFSPGSVFAGCRIERRLGQGGMGTVYLAHQLALERLVAIKVVNPDMGGDGGFHKRFASESRIAAQVEHPNVVPVYGGGEEDGVLYMLMRYVEGRDLGELLAAEHRLDPSRAARLIGQVASGLDAVHAAGLVHRDVKPGNVLVTGSGAGEQAYLTDFGLAKPVASTSGHTGTGQFVGSVNYVAPEQIEGRRVDARADVYALGCLLFQALAHEVAFPRDDVPATLYAHMSAPPPLPSARVGTALAPFDPVMARAMAKEPAERYPSAGDLGRAAAAAATGHRAAGEPERSVATGPAAPTVAGSETPAAATAPIGAGRRRRVTPVAVALLAIVLSAAVAMAIARPDLLGDEGGGSSSGGSGGSGGDRKPDPPPLRPSGTLSATAIGEVELGDTTEEVKRAFGKPDETEEIVGERTLSGREFSTVWNYVLDDGELRLHFDFESGGLTGYSSVSERLMTAQGIKFGDTVARLREVYGDRLRSGGPAVQTEATFSVRRSPKQRFPALVFFMQQGAVGAIEGGNPPPNGG